MSAPPAPPIRPHADHHDPCREVFFARLGEEEAEAAAEGETEAEDNQEEHRSEAGDDEFLEDCAPRRSLPDPGQPTRAQLEEHRKDHLPFRLWCPECVAGRATGEQHRRRLGPRGVPVFSFDYLFITKNRDIKRRGDIPDEEEVTVKVLVACDAKSKAVFAHTVEAKGVSADRYAVDCLVKDVQWLGYSRLSLKSDNEPAILKLLTETLKDLRIAPGDGGSATDDGATPRLPPDAREALPASTLPALSTSRSSQESREESEGGVSK